MKRSAINHPKLFELCDQLDIPLYQAVGLLESLWIFTAKFTPAGDLGKFSNEAICRFIQWRNDPNTLIDALILSKWIDADTVSRLRVHDWHEHADDAVHMTLARNGQLFADGNLPKTNRLGKAEREHAQALLVRTQSARRAHGKRTKSASCGVALPSHPIPSHTKDLSSAETADPPGNSAPPPDPDPPPLTPTELAEGWNEYVATPLGLPPVTLPLTTKRLDKARLRCREHPDDAWWGDVFAQISRSRFLRGLNGSTSGTHAGWKCTFDFLIDNDTNATKVHEGAYDR